ncbi:MAG: ATPase [Piscirickettsiaceae bacterium]|nr:MAG: ATPase [Piscirickettsiaceae bacterium]PCI68774.1 MAG: ATPase [Piscirickettsiaceae bacterium]
MKIEKLKDIINWTRDSHEALANCMKRCVNENENARARLLLNYLIEHEEKLGNVLDEFNKSGNANALNTWCIEYLDKSPVVLRNDNDRPFAQMQADEIMGEISRHHQQIIELYTYLLGQADIPEAQDLLKQLVSLEEHEVMRMAQAANRLRDL